jgi:hypothetical protein
VASNGPLGAKKLRRAERLVGFPLSRAVAWESWHWAAWTPDGRRLDINPRTGMWAWDDPSETRSLAERLGMRRAQGMTLAEVLREPHRASSPGA